MEVQFPSEYVDGYLDSYLTVSHPRIIPHRKHEDDAGPSHVGSSHDGFSHADARGVPDDMAPPSPPPRDEDNAQRL